MFTMVPAWLKLGAVGLGMLILGLLVPPAAHSIPIVAGALMLLGALLWSRLWITEVVGARSQGTST